MASNNQSDNSNSQFSNPLDANLLNRPTKSSAEKVGELKEAQRGGQTEEGDSQVGQSQAETTIREQQIVKKREAAIAAITAEEQEKKKTADAKPNPVNQATSNLLKKAWLSIIPTWGLSIIWINIHVFLGTVFSEKFFCKLGMEWINTSIKQAQFDQAKKLGKVAGTFEGAGLACLDLGCLMLIIAVTVVISLILNIFTLEGLSTILGWIWDQAKEAFKSL